MTAMVQDSELFAITHDLSAQFTCPTRGATPHPNAFHT